MLGQSSSRRYETSAQSSIREVVWQVHALPDLLQQVVWLWQCCCILLLIRLYGHGLRNVCRYLPDHGQRGQQRAACEVVRRHQACHRLCCRDELRVAQLGRPAVVDALADAWEDVDRGAHCWVVCGARAGGHGRRHAVCCDERAVVGPLVDVACRRLLVDVLAERQHNRRRLVDVGHGRAHVACELEVWGPLHREAHQHARLHVLHRSQQVGRRGAFVAEGQLVALKGLRASTLARDEALLVDQPYLAPRLQHRRACVLRNGHRHELCRPRRLLIRAAEQERVVLEFLARLWLSSEHRR
mmetsp:Transcript_37445/g.110590  ORF Transcript_37445/g.110590 Transcript_37445/m.110590 type:complete len:299 (-) Transcript_37445:1172-2068(-)